MKLYTKSSGQEGAADSRPVSRRNAGSPEAGITLVEVTVTMALLTMLIIATFSGILTMKLNSTRLADYTAVMALVEAKIEDIRAATYNPPNYPFGVSTLYLTNNNTIDLNQSGSTFLTTGTVVSKIEPVVAGHLITVTATFAIGGNPMSATLQTVVNKFCQGQE